MQPEEQIPGYSYNVITSGSAANDSWLPVSPRARTLWRIESLLAPLIPFLAFGVPTLIVSLAVTKEKNAPLFGPDSWNRVAMLGGAYVLVALIIICTVEARYRACRYRVTDNDVAVRYGVFVRNKHYVARHRIQHVDINAGMIARSLGLATLNIYVAGGKAAHIAGLEELEAERIRQHLLRPEDA
jgi:membrane protein YdbS with pleckstrin-like domain